MARKLRIAFLLLVLVIVAGNAWLARKGDIDWNIPHTLIIYPINGDGSEAAARYIQGLDRDTFRPVAEFMDLESRAYDLEQTEPVSVDLAEELSSRPPEAPFGGSRLQVMLWSLRMRWWAWMADNHNDVGGVRMFVLYFDPAVSEKLDHSLGLMKGRLGVVKAFASRLYASRNNVIIAHEFLHVLGATDKYDPATGMPAYPDGFAEPDRRPLYPQEKAEIMGGLIPLSKDEGVMPGGLWQTEIGPVTAREIGWLGDQ